jgi:gluconate:H+ symporter, GntP family
MTLPPLLILLVGMATVIGAILLFRLHAFLALIGAAIVVSLLAPGEPAVKITRVAEALGTTAGNIGIVIALAAVIGKAMLDSGAADRIVQGFLAMLGEKRGATALVSSGYVLAIPVFFDTVFYLLVPLARSMYRRTGRHYLKFVMAVAAGGAATHNLVPPTPGPLVVAGTLGIDLGTMLLMGIVISIPAAGIGLLFSAWVDRRMPIVPADEPGSYPAADESETPRGPGLFVSVLPILLPVALISGNTVVGSLTTGPDARTDGTLAAIAPYMALIGNANTALLFSAIVALWVYAKQRRPSRTQMAGLVEESLMSAGVIILITAAGGAFGAMLRAAEMGPAIQQVFAGAGGAGMMFLFLGFGVSTLIKIAQGSSTVANITTAGMLSAMLAGTTLPFHTVYVGTAIASGALVGSWMNDSGFWIFSRMAGLTELETLKSWTPLLAVIGVSSLLMTLLLAIVLPMK